MKADIKLSKRLKMVASFISEGTFFADIGSDHAYLPCYICLKDEKARAIAGEVREGPYKRAEETVAAYQLSDKVEVRLGDGLQIINSDEGVKELVVYVQSFVKINYFSEIIVAPIFEASIIAVVMFFFFIVQCVSF